MADFGTILNNSNNSLDLYCKSIRTYDSPPFVKCTSLTNIISNGSVLIEWTGERIGGNFNVPNPSTDIVFQKRGVYRVSVSCPVSLQTSGDAVLSLYYTVMLGDAVLYTSIVVGQIVLSSTVPNGVITLNEIHNFEPNNVLRVYISNNGSNILQSVSSIDINWVSHFVGFP